MGEPDLARCLENLSEQALRRAPPFPVTWYPGEFAPGTGRLGVCSLPGEQPHAIRDDPADLADEGVTHLVCLVEASELASLEPSERPSQRAAAVTQAGMAFLHEPIEDFEAPTMAQVHRVIDFANRARASGGSVVFHCWADLGRAGTLLACALVHAGMSAHDAMATTRWIRPGAIQSRAQEDCVRTYATPQ